MEEASYLAGICSEVLLVHRRDDFRASKAMQDRVRSNPKIKLALSSAIVEVFDPAEGKVTGVAVKDLKTGEVRRHATDALFIAIGHTPMTDLVKGQVELQSNGYVKVQPGTTTTSVPGVFAAGDVADWVYRQAITAAGTGCMAALEAERWLVANDDAH